MSDGLNRVMLIGRLAADGELRFVQSGQAVLNMRMAVSESYLDRNKVRQERTEWVNCTIWGKRAEALSKILSKGSQIYVEGSLRTSSYEDKQGQKRFKTEVNATNVILCGGKRDSSGGDSRQQPPPAAQASPGGQDELPPDDFDVSREIPF